MTRETAVQQLVERFNERWVFDEEVRQWIAEALELEQEQIQEAFDNGSQNFDEVSGLNYYRQTFKS
jgi:energy-converting hydrogenase A subunit M